MSETPRTNRYQSQYDADMVAAMEELGVGAAEVYSYAVACLPQRELANLVEALESTLPRPPIRGSQDSEAQREPESLLTV